MIVLGIETATPVCSVGLAGDNGLIAETRLVRKNSHAEVLAGMVDQVCNSAVISLESLDGIAVSIGPGSFTGLRIGLGYAKGIVLGMGMKLIAVPTLDALICHVLPVRPWAVVLLMARKGEAYRGVYQWQNKQWIQRKSVETVTDKNLFVGLPEEEMLFAGNGVDSFKDVLLLDQRAVFFNSISELPGGYNVAALGREKLLSGDWTSPDDVVPQYVQRFQGVS